MIATVFLALGLVLIVEGLVYALAPSFIEQMLVTLRILTDDQKRMIGLVSIAFGGVLVWCARALGI